MADSEYPIRTRFARDIVAEVLLPKKQSGKVAILCGGAPSSPYSKRRLKFFADRGYIVIAPRYRGTWESEGWFLEKSPAKDIHDIITELSEKKSLHDIYTGKIIRLKVSKIHLFGASFGGPAVLLNTGHRLVEKVIALAPVLNWKIKGESEDFNFFVRFTEQAFGGSYRTQTPRVWKKLTESDFYNPVDHIASVDGKKVLILHAMDDAVVPYEPVADFSQKTKSTYYLKPKGGHDISMTHQFLWKKIDKFLRSH